MQHLLPQLGPVTAVIGAQWGDEGKGKIVDVLAPYFAIIARACGGANAGHTIIVGGKKHVFHLLPAGCLHAGKEIILGGGMVIDLPTLLQEIQTLREAGIDIIPRLHISKDAHVVLGYHRTIDALLETERGDGNIGTTKRGIGPAYADKALRIGLRLGDLARGDIHRGNIPQQLRATAALLGKRYGFAIDAESELQRLCEAQEALAERIEDTTTLLLQSLHAKKTILIEGAQGTLLDCDHGTYPYVTSSSTTAAGALQGLGLPPKALTSCIGVAKAYCTRVGSGPFPGEEAGPRGDDLRERGGEYGATTGRPRRCGWLSLDDLAYATALNGFTHVNLTKLDVLDPEETIPLFERDKRRELPGWKQTTRGKRSFAELPPNARKYIEEIERTIGVPLAFIGTGPEREEMIVQ